MKLTSIKSIQDIKEFVRILMVDENLNFHPDTPFEDYVFVNCGLPFYTKEAAERRNALLNQAFELGESLGENIHEVMCVEGNKYLFA